MGGWKPKFKFKKESAAKLFSFGWKVLVTELIYTIEGDIRSLIVGKVFGPSDLAYYDQGKKYPSLLVTNINSSINKVMLPAYSKTQDNKDKLKNMLRKSIKVGVFILAPVLIGFAVISNSFVSLLLTDKWINAIPYIQVFCLVYLTRPLESSCHQALLSIGESGMVMIIMLGINIFAIITVLIAVFVFKSVLLIAVGNLISTIVSLIMFMYVAYKKIDYKPKEQIIDVFPSLFQSTIMCVCVYLLGLLCLNLVYKLIIQITMGIIVYIILSICFKNSSYLYIKSTLFSFIKKINRGK